LYTKKNQETVYKEILLEQGVVAHAWNPSMQEAVTGASQVQGLTTDQNPLEKK
jgi:hypothetical protein